MPNNKKPLPSPPPIILHTCGNIDLFVFPGKTEDCRLQLDGLFDQVEILLINIEYPSMTSIILHLDAHHEIYKHESS